HRGRGGEFLLHDEYDPRRAILFNADGSVWKSGVAPAQSQYFLNFDATDGRNTLPGCIQPTNQGCAAMGIVQTDGDDAIFGDLGNDWMVGGTGKDTIWAGWGNDLSNADDDLRTNDWLNDIPKGSAYTSATDTHPTYEDRVYGGAGLDILMGNTGGDRLIDWVGEFNSYIVPFAPFGSAAVSRQVLPGLPEFLYNLSRSQGADQTLALANPQYAARNGEPYAELGVIVQQDSGLWQDQTGGPRDPQPGTVPGGSRDVLRAADFNNQTTSGFFVDTGVWQVSGGALTVAAGSLGLDASAVFY